MPMTIGIEIGFGAFTPAAASGNKWNSADNSNFVLSNGDRTATSGGVSRSQIRSITTRSSGKYYFEFSWAGSNSNTGQCIGIVDSTASLPQAVSYLGTGANAVGLLRNNFLAFNGGFSTQQAGVQANVAANICALAVDLTNEKIWMAGITSASGWFGATGAADPVAGTGGYDFAAASVATWAVCGFADTLEAMALTVNLGGSAFTGSVPSGYSAWG